ncbi:RagB/SusD family nutrient uptake outer membrane protein [Chitinophaga sedimenti]|uniref:RagB/SusD family nutrient uptake outer membrane protein n=1 Tax=Chitinophaga sedimenti TaxID=2033606 RepID=UPI002005824B|nr:RagB/SusD family nutrient uptake outer membrane protein [Chitinophaga sedimenti]MCK7557119.1 RagB/SusD family nutrient uptake outer membrane protein [Chitinophaga sedimenti]
MKKLAIYIGITAAVLSAGSCKLDYGNPNGPTEDQIITSREGMFTLAVGLKQFYSQGCMQNLINGPGVTTRELKGVSTFTNVPELEAGGTSLPTFNANILNLWTAMLRAMGMADNLITHSKQVVADDLPTQTGLVAFGSLFKAMTISGLATAYEQFPTTTSVSGNMPFVTRTVALEQAITLLDDAATALAANPPSAEFNSRVLGSNFILLDCINAYRARINMMLGRYPQSLAAANLVNLATKSTFDYNVNSQNPIYTQIILSANFKPRANFGLPAGLYEANDGRLAFYLATPDVVVGGETLKTVKGFFDALDKSIPVYMPDEVRLLKAEAIIRSGGDLNTAKTHIDAVRTQTSGDPFNVYPGLPAYTGPLTPDALLTEVYKQRSAELFMQGLRLEDSRRFGRPQPPTNVNPVPVTFERNRNFYPYPDQERLNNTNTPADPAI